VTTAHPTNRTTAPLLVAIVALFAIGVASDAASIEPEATYHGVNRPIPVRIDLGETEGARIALYGMESGARLGVSGILPTDGRTVDLAALFPVVWTARRPVVMAAQLEAGGDPVGAPVVVQPVVEPPRAIDGLTAAVMDAFERSDAAELTRLLQLDREARRRLRDEVVLDDGAHPVVSGVRVWVHERVTLDTDAGPIELDVAPWAAPETTARFLELVRGGFYDGVAFHRVVPRDERGAPFLIQAGDPSGTGGGGAGSWTDFEPTPMRHDAGVVSMARRPGDPNSNGSQFLICLSREACSSLDGRYTAFARVVGGMETVWSIATAPADDDGTPETPVVIRRAVATPAPPFDPAAAGMADGGDPDDQ